VSERASRFQAVTLLMACAAVFLAGYQLTLRRALRLEDLPGSQGPWDAWVPFWPASIVVYCSINVTYALAFFVVRDGVGLHRLAARLLLVQLACFACFVGWPMRMQRRPDVGDTVWAPWFQALASFDGASNLVPSLHVAILGVLWSHFRAGARARWARVGVDAWAVCVALSALTTWQHNVMDVLAGAALAWVVVRWLVKDDAFWKEP
jgi:PAP2 superfamily